MPMNKKSTYDYVIKEKKESLSPKDSTIVFLMNLARVYSSNPQQASSTGGYILN